MRVGWVEIRLLLHPADWRFERWQWWHEDFVKNRKVKTVLFGLQIGPFEMGLWVFKPGQYAIIRADDALRCGPALAPNKVRDV